MLAIKIKKKIKGQYLKNKFVFLLKNGILWHKLLKYVFTKPPL